MSAFTEAVLTTEGGPLIWNRLNTTTPYVNIGSGGASGNLAKNGGVVEVLPSLLPGEQGGKCIYQLKDTPAAKRINNALIDNPGAQPVTVMIWFRPDTMKATMPLVAKPGQYALSVEADGMMRGVVANQDDLYWPFPEREAARVWPNGRTYCAAMRWDPGAVLGRRLWAIRVNGAPAVSRALPASQTIPTSANDFELGGQDVFGAQGFWGSLQELIVWYRAVPDAQLQLLYRLSVQNQEERYGLLVDVMPTTRVIADGGPRGRILTNLSDEPITAFEGNAAFLDGGWLVPPGQSRVLDTDTAISALHDGIGPKRVRIFS